MLNVADPFWWWGKSVLFGVFVGLMGLNRSFCWNSIWSPNLFLVGTDILCGNLKLKQTDK